MKKTKLIPSIIMFILCVAVLAIGVYAVSPTTHNIVGTVTISAGGANVRIAGYLDDGDGDFSDDVKVTDTYTSRISQTISIYANALDFDCSSAFDISEVAEKKLYFKVENLSTYSLGAYFLEGNVPDSGATLSNIAESKNFSGNTQTGTIENLITANFSGYTEIASNGYTYMFSALTLNKLNDKASTVSLNLNLNVEKYNENLIILDDSIQVVNENKLNIVADCAVNYANISNNKIIFNSGVWALTGMGFSSEKYSDGSLRLKTIEMKINITNHSLVPLSATVSENKNNTPQNLGVDVTMIGNSYIKPGDTGEVGVQFSAVYDRSVSTPQIPTINTFGYKIEINQAQEVSETYVYDLITYDSDTTGMPGNGFNYYIEYGDNPYVAGEKLRWYVWAKDNGNGEAIPLEDSDKITDSTTGKKKLAKGNIYYFISEHILNVTSSRYGISYQNEYFYNADGDSLTNVYGDDATDYAGSNLREYLNGTTIKNKDYTSDQLVCFPNGQNVNFVSTFNFASSPIYSLINKRSLQSLYSDMSMGDNGPWDFPVNNKNVSLDDKDRFWLLSTKEYDNCFGASSGKCETTPLVNTGMEDSEGENIYWNRSVCCDCEMGAVSGSYTEAVFWPNESWIGVRPAFMLEA